MERAIYFVGIADDLKHISVVLNLIFGIAWFVLSAVHTCNKDLGLPARISGRLALIAGYLNLAFFLAWAFIPDSQIIAILTNLQWPRP